MIRAFLIKVKKNFSVFDGAIWSKNKNDSSGSDLLLKIKNNTLFGTEMFLFMIFFCSSYFILKIPKKLFF